jgi:hypothetical protein
MASSDSENEFDYLAASKHNYLHIPTGSYFYHDIPIDIFKEKVEEFQLTHEELKTVASHIMDCSRHDLAEILLDYGFAIDSKFIVTFTCYTLENDDFFIKYTGNSVYDHYDQSSLERRFYYCYENIRNWNDSQKYEQEIQKILRLGFDPNAMHEWYKKKLLYVSNLTEIQMDILKTILPCMSLDFIDSKLIVSMIENQSPPELFELLIDHGLSLEQFNNTPLPEKNVSYIDSLEKLGFDRTKVIYYLNKKF